MNSTTTSDCIIIGGGIVGMMSARELAMQGLKIRIFDSGALGSQCSWAGGGILSPLYPWRIQEELWPLCRWGQGQYPLLAESLSQDTGVDSEWVQCGMLILDAEDWDKALAWAGKHKISLQEIGPGQLAAYAPAVGGNFRRALWMPETAQVRNPRLLSALKICLRELGVEIVEYTAVRKINLDQHRVLGVETGRGSFSAPMVVITSGAWSSRLLPAIPIKPVRGQMLCFLAPGDFLRTIVLKDGCYAIPRRDGHILIGSTVEDAGFDNSVTPEVRDQLSVLAEEMLPGIRQFPLVAHWSGLRPAGPTDFPYIGAWPEIEGLFVNTGHYRNGLLLAPGSARLLVDIILKRETLVPVHPYQPNGGLASTC
jgi:glycine oxidase ThiO